MLPGKCRNGLVAVRNSVTHAVELFKKDKKLPITAVSVILPAAVNHPIRIHA